MELTTLTLDIIRAFNLPEESYKPDYDDAGFKFILPSGIELMGFFMLNGEPCEMDSLEGLDGWIYITTKEELENLVLNCYDEIIDDIHIAEDDFPLEDYR